MINLRFDLFCFIIFFPSIHLVHDTWLEDHLQEGVPCVLFLAQRSDAIPAVWQGRGLGLVVDNSVHLTEQLVVLVPRLHQLTPAQQWLLVLIRKLWSLLAQLRQEIHEEWSVEVLTELIENKPVTNSLGGALLPLILLPISEFALLNVILNFDEFACSSKISVHSQIYHLKAEKSEPATSRCIVITEKLAAALTLFGKI